MAGVADESTGETKLDLAKRAAVEALDEFKDADEVGLRTFTTDIDTGATLIQDLVAAARVGDVRENLANRIRELVPLNGTPLYEVARSTYEQLAADYDPARINAMVLLTDGQNDDGDSSDDTRQLEDLIASLSESAEGATSQPVRVFTIAYGGDADLTTLQRIAEASTGAAYDASDPRSITKVFTAVVSNF
jgi:Ca-activated chloride channel family protein